MGRKPDLLMVLVAVFGIGALVSNYTMGGSDPEKVAQEIEIAIR